jgi:putative ABC transport system ATP-binding protein
MPTHPQSQDGASVVAAHDVTRRYGEDATAVEALRGVSLEVRASELVAVMGPSGSGKSTLMHTLAGLDKPTTGSIEIAGIDITGMDDTKLTRLRRDHIGFVFQFFNLLPSMTAAENVALPLRLRNESWLRPTHRVAQGAIKERVSALMDQLGLHGLQGHGPEEISGGEQQRVAIARALAAAPALLLADEPTGNLDWNARHEVLALLVQLCRMEKQTTLLVTHDAVAAAYADRVVVMRDGVFVDEITLSHPDGDGATRPDPARLIARLSKLDL